MIMQKKKTKVVLNDLLRTDCRDGHETVGDNEQCIFYSYIYQLKRYDLRYSISANAIVYIYATGLSSVEYC
jgi:hypothetical protein